MNLDKRILAILVVNILLLGNIGRYENIEFNKKIIEQDLTGESNIYSDMTSNPIEEPLKDNLITHLPNLAIESTGQILEDTDEFLAGSLSNLTIDSEGNLILDKSHIENWKDITTPGPSARRGHAMAYDSKLEKIILFGGEHGRNLFYDTWVYDLGTYTWTEIYTPEMFPDPRVDHAMVYSPAAEKVLLFGGVNEWGEVLNDMWVFDPNTNTWDYKDYNSFPTHIPARCGHSLVYDPFEEGIYLFGGYDYFNTYYQDCWFLEWEGGDLAEWYYFIPYADVPSPRAFHSMTCIYSTEDPMDRVAILFGGKNDEDTFEDTWVYDFYGRWILLTPSSLNVAI